MFKNGLQMVLEDRNILKVCILLMRIFECTYRENVGWSEYSNKNVSVNIYIFISIPVQLKFTLFFPLLLRLFMIAGGFLIAFLISMELCWPMSLIHR